MKSNSPKISVCIVTYRRDNDLMQSLAHLLKSTFEDYEILIVDNGHSKDLPALLDRLDLSSQLRLIQAPENRGCANLNLLFQEARGDVIACFDDDSYPRRDCLEQLWKVFQEHSNMGMIGFKMHVPQTGEPWHDQWWNPDEPNPRPTVFCPGCGLAFRNDPRLPKELCIPEIVSQAHELSMAAEIARLGYRIEFRPDCVAYHPDTKTGYHGAKEETGSLNQLRFLLEYGDTYTLLLLKLTHLILSLRKQKNSLAFIKELRAIHGKRALDRRTVRRFSEIVAWHIHPRLQRFVLRPVKQEVASIL